MLMSRRAPAAWRDVVQSAVWPRRGWARTIRYHRLRLLRMRVLPRSLALGAAAGVFVAILPIPGIQLLAAAGLAWLVRGHRATAALATFAANPITYPMIWVASYALGATILGTPVSDAAHDLDMLGDVVAQGWTSEPAAIKSVLPAFRTLAVGAVPLAALAALVAYLCVRRILRARDVQPEACSVHPISQRRARRLILRPRSPALPPAKIAA